MLTTKLLKQMSKEQNQPQRKPLKLFRWKQIAQELERRKSSSSDEESIEALVFDGRGYDSPWVEALNNYFGGYVRINNLFSNPFPCPLSIFLSGPIHGRCKPFCPCEFPKFECLQMIS